MTKDLVFYRLAVLFVSKRIDLQPLLYNVHSSSYIGGRSKIQINIHRQRERLFWSLLNEQFGCPCSTLIQRRRDGLASIRSFTMDINLGKLYCPMFVNKAIPVSNLFYLYLTSICNTHASPSAILRLFNLDSLHPIRTRCHL